MSKPANRVRKLVVLTLPLLKLVENYRAANFIASESEALRRLIVAGLKIESPSKESAS